MDYWIGDQALFPPANERVGRTEQVDQIKSTIYSLEASVDILFPRPSVNVTNTPS